MPIWSDATHGWPSSSMRRRQNAPVLAILLAVCVSGVGSREARAIDPYAGIDPYWVLLHEPAVIDELKLRPSQQQAYVQLLDQLDLRYFPLRNKTRDEALAGMELIIAEARQQLKSLLTPAQRNRLNQILLLQLGNSSLLLDDIAAQMRYTGTQREQLKTILDETEAAITAINGELNAGKPREPLEKKFTELKAGEQSKVAALLSPQQQSALKKLLGPPFPLSSLRRPAFKAPELVHTSEWINSSPLRLDELRGKVVVVHFYASGCINCIRNYPWYRQWHDGFNGKDVVLVGIHTPETASERNGENVRRKAAEEKLAFPILIDGKNDNWNAWGNSMWPSVYLVDKRGYVRDFWPGELKWQGNDGEKYMRERIEGLLAE